jgi:hypothetical protein
MSVFFTRSSTECKLSNPTWPEGEESSPNQTVGISDGGALKIARNGEDEVLVRLNFVRLTSAEYTVLSSFMKSTITYSAYTFQYQDWNQVTRNNMRYMSGFNSFKRERGGRYNGTLVLREDLGV